MTDSADTICRIFVSGGSSDSRFLSTVDFGQELPSLRFLRGRSLARGMVGSAALDEQINFYFYIWQKCKDAVALAFPVFKPPKKQVIYIAA